jgi:hypothetical protein
MALIFPIISLSTNAGYPPNGNGEPVRHRRIDHPQDEHPDNCPPERAEL